MKKQYKVTLTTDERNQFLQIVSTGKSSVAKIKHANILLAVDETANGKVSDIRRSMAVGCHVYFVEESEFMDT